MRAGSRAGRGPAPPGPGVCPGGTRKVPAAAGQTEPDFLAAKSGTADGPFRVSLPLRERFPHPHVSLSAAAAANVPLPLPHQKSELLCRWTVAFCACQMGNSVRIR